MNFLDTTIRRIPAVDDRQKKIIERTLRQCLPQSASLGALPELLGNYAGISGSAQLALPKKCTVIACADHGVAAMKTSAYPVETTVQMTKNYLIAKGAVANALSNFSKSDMIVVDMGIAAPMDGIGGLIDRKIALGTKNCAVGPAMTRTEALQAIRAGIEIADAYAQKGYKCFLPGEMGIANTTSSAAIVAVFCGLAPEQATGRGTNISDERLKLKIEVVRRALEVNRPNPGDALDVLEKVGGFELGCIAGLILGAAANRAFVVLDGFNTGAAALIAAALCPKAKDYLMGSHLAAEPAHRQTLQKLGLRPYMDMKFRLGEATGSSIAVNLLDASVKVYRQITGQEKTSPPVKSIQINHAALTREFLCHYVENIKPLDQEKMEQCQLYIDNLTKPIHSLGALEELAVKTAGIFRSMKPAWQKKSLVSFSADTSDLTNAFAVHAEASITVLDQIYACPDCLAALIYGLKSAESLCARGEKIIGFAAPPARDAAAEKLLAALEKASGREDALAALENMRAPELAAMAGVIIGGACARALLIADGFASQAAACLAAKLAPAVKEYLFIPEYAPRRQNALRRQLGLADCLSLNITAGSGCMSALGMKLADAAMHMVNDMKTFEDAAVATADDGPGNGRQTRRQAGASARS